MRRARDSQKAKLYRAERDDISKGRTFKDICETKKFVAKVISSKWSQKHFLNYMSIVVKDGRGTRIARSYGDVINVPVWARNELIVLHELAHSLRIGSNSEHSSHGWLFCNTFLKLVKHFMGKETHDKLKQSFKKHKVRFNRPYKRKSNYSGNPEALKKWREQQKEIKSAASQE